MKVKYHTISNENETFKMFIFEELIKMTNEYPTILDFYGAIKGMVVLNYAYYLNITAAVLDDKLSYVTHNKEMKEFPTYERLSLVDIEQFAVKAFDTHDYALSIVFVRNLLKLLPKVKDKDFKIFEEMKGMSNRVNIMRENLVKLNNGYLDKTQTFINSNGRVLTYKVDKNLKRKKKQPKFIEDRSIYKANWDIQNQFGPEWLMMQTCQKGKWLTPKYKVAYPCRYLHHNDPYLKLGPFKEEWTSFIPYSVVFHDILSEKEIGKPITKCLFLEFWHKRD